MPIIKKALLIVGLFNFMISFIILWIYAHKISYGITITPFMRKAFMVLCILILSCNSNKINRAVLSYQNENNEWDSVILQNQNDLDLIDKALKSKTFIWVIKVPRAYEIKITRNNDSTEDYDGNGPLLRSDNTYIIRDTILQKEFLRLINSKLPAYKHQSGIIDIDKLFKPPLH